MDSSTIIYSIFHRGEQSWIRNMSNNLALQVFCISYESKYSVPLNFKTFKTHRLFGLHNTICITFLLDYPHLFKKVTFIELGVIDQVLMKLCTSISIRNRSLRRSPLVYVLSYLYCLRPLLEQLCKKLVLTNFEKYTFLKDHFRATASILYENIFSRVWIWVQFGIRGVL